MDNKGICQANSDLSTVGIYDVLSGGGILMSLAATIALMTTAVVAKLRPPDLDVETTKRIAELERQVEELEVRLDAARQEAREWEALSSSWRARYEQTVLPYAQAQAQMNAMQMQYAAAQNQMAAQQSPFYGQGLSQMQRALNPDFDGFCNCVPSRSQVWAANRG
jgi:hypothetical protein